MNFIESFICPYCKNSIISNIRLFDCPCGATAFYQFDNHNCFYLDLPEGYLIKISYTKHDTLFEFIKKGVDFSLISLDFDYIPEKLDFTNIDKLVKQLEIMVTFK